MQTKPNPQDVLTDALQRVRANLEQPIILNKEILDKVRFVSRCQSNRAGARMLMACALAKVYHPQVDIRKPYTEIGDNDSFSGRATYDEAFVWPFASEHDLPVNPTSAFLTPGFRTINVPLAPPLVISGRPKKMYEFTIQLLDDVHQGRVSAQDLLAETIRQLLLLKQERENRIQQMLDELGAAAQEIPLSSEDIVRLIEQHLNSPRSSRLPVLVVAAVYKAAEQKLGERIKPLHAHTAADSQTGALGDLEITLVNDENIVTSYEMKAKDVVIADIELALEKIKQSGTRVDNCIFITTGRIDPDVVEYANSLHRATGGIEFAILDCIGFLRHFIHLFHRLRLEFLNTYQQLVLEEPDSAVNHALKEVFLALRRAAEIDAGS